LATFAYDEAATLPTIDVPTLVVTGHLDRVLVPEASEWIRASLPLAELETLRPAGHMGLLEQHERFNEVVGAFAARCFQAGPMPSSHLATPTRAEPDVRTPAPS
jgi:pimeloyl-ACP methyl ester carboxylesterase